MKISNSILLLIWMLFFTPALSGMANACYSSSDSELIRVVYQTRGGNLEVATDLGAVSSLIGGTDLVVGGGADAFTNFGVTPDNFQDFSVAYFAVLLHGGPHDASNVWVSGDDTDSPLVSRGKWRNGIQKLETIYSSYGFSDEGSDTVAINKRDRNSYWRIADGSGEKTGSLAGIIRLGSREFTEASLCELANGGSLLQGLWDLDDGGKRHTGILAALIRTNADGSTTINPVETVPTPIPASLPLLASGFAFVGIFYRRSCRQG